MTYSGTSKTTFETFRTLESDLQKIHNNKYTYNNTVFVNVRTKFLITCPIHGDFSQQPRDHKRGKGCRKCYDIKPRTHKKTKKDVLKELVQTIGNKFLFLDMSWEYKNAHCKIGTICKTCDSFKYRKINSLLTGHAGCQNCKNNIDSWTSKRYENKPTTLYYAKIENVYKIGLTRKNIKSRFYKEIKNNMNIKLICSWEYKNGADAFNQEQLILKKFKKSKYHGHKILLSGGDSELFTYDVLNLDKFTQEV